MLAQTFTDYEVIVVDDGSTDQTQEVIAGYGDRVCYLLQPNSGPGAARDLGIRRASGEYVAFLDSDDVWFPWTLASYHLAIQRCGRPGFVCGKCLKFVERDELETAHQENLQCQLFPDYYAAGPEPIDIVGCGVVVRTAAILSTGGFLKGLVNAEDSDMWMKLGTVSGFAYLTSPAVFGYRENPTSVSKIASKTAAGIRRMVASEQGGAYPGGKSRRRERWRILTRHVRPASLGCLKGGEVNAACRLYWNSVPWHFALGKFRYLIGFPLLIVRRFAAMTMSVSPRTQERNRARTADSARKCASRNGMRGK